MIKLIVAYGTPDDERAFNQAYTEQHAPLARAIPNVRNLEVGQVLGTADGSTPPYHLIVQLSFDDRDALQQAMQSTDGRAAAEHAAEIATGGVTFLIVEAV